MIQLTDKLYVIEVPVETTAHYISNTGFVCGYQYRGYREVLYYEQLDGNYTILGTCTDDDIDFDVEPYVQPSKDFPEYKYGGEVHPKETYWDYERGMYCGSIYNLDDSFRSLLTSKGIDLTIIKKFLVIQKID